MSRESGGGGSPATKRLDLGSARIVPERQIVAGSLTTIEFTYTAGHPVDDSGYVKIVFRQMGDFGAPQFSDPAAPNFCTIRTTGDCCIEPRWDPKGHLRPWSAALYLQVQKGFLAAGEEIVVVFGDRSGGSPGWQMQTFCERTFEFKTFVDPIATARFKELPVSPAVCIVPGPPARAVCIAPSQVLIDEPFSYHLKLEDRWGNPTGALQRKMHAGFAEPGVETVTEVDRETGLSATSNPIRMLAKDTPLRPFWADFHGQSEETIGTNSIDDYFTFARDVGLLDVAAHQGNDFQVTDELWEEINHVSAAFNEPGRFVTFPGYEWSGNTPLGGDRNVFYASEGGPVSRSCRDLIPGHDSVYEDSPTATSLFANLAIQKEPRAFVFAHVGGRYADLTAHDPAIEVAVEVHSGWGTFEWLVEDALRRGFRVGICANSDDHKGNPGASYRGAGAFGVLGGLTCVLAKTLDRESVLESLLARHFYATTGNRSLVDLTLVTADGRSAVMGDVVEVGVGTPTLRVHVVGTAPIERVDVLNGLELLRTLRPFGEEDLGRRVKIVWRGAEVRGRGRMVRWDGGLHVRGNDILGAGLINPWNANANHPLEVLGKDRLAWKSVTTGGAGGVILTLETSDSGALVIKTAQRDVECDVASVGLEPMIVECGGLGKRIEICRLPDRQDTCSFQFVLPLDGLRAGDNPVFIRATQEDGHMAWSSPVYVHR